MIRKVLQIGNPLLLERSTPVALDEFNTHSIKSLVNDMIDTMREKGGVGISAIQIGIKLRVAIIEYDTSNPRYSEIGDCPLTVLINPEIHPISDEMSEYKEGCLSVPDIRDIVIRPKHIGYKYYDMMGRMIIGQSDGFFARVLQHELDHMDGILFVARCL